MVSRGEKYAVQFDKQYAMNYGNKYNRQQNLLLTGISPVIIVVFEFLRNNLIVRQTVNWVTNCLSNKSINLELQARKGVILCRGRENGGLNSMFFSSGVEEKRCCFLCRSVNITARYYYGSIFNKFGLKETNMTVMSPHFGKLRMTR